MHLYVKTLSLLTPVWAHGIASAGREDAHEAAVRRGAEEAGGAQGESVYQLYQVLVVFLLKIKETIACEMM